MDVLNITIARQQAEVEVILGFSISKNNFEFHIDMTDVILLILYCNILFPKNGSI